MQSLIPTSLYKTLDAVQSNLNHAYGAIQSYVFTKNPDDIRLTGSVNTKYPTMSEKRTVADYKKSVEGYPDIDANKIKVRDKTEAAKRESDKLEHSLPILSERQQRQLQETADISLVNVDAKRMASEDQKVQKWTVYDPNNHRGSFNSLAVVWNELNRPNEENPKNRIARAFTDSVAVEYTTLPYCTEDPFTHPVLVDDRLRNLFPGGFDMLADRIKGNEYYLCPTPDAPYNYAKYTNREAVPALVRDNSDCNPDLVRSIASFKPASCKSFDAGDLIAQIDNFFAENRTKDNVGCVVFVDVATIDRWVKESSYLQELDNPTVIAFRLNEETIKERAWTFTGYLLGFTGLVTIVLGIARLDEIKDKCSSITCSPSGHPENTAKAAADTPDNNARANPDSVDNDGADDNYRSRYLGDSSTSSKEEEEEEDLQAIVIASKRTDGNVSGGSDGETSEEED